MSTPAPPSRRRRRPWRRPASGTFASGLQGMLAVTVWTLALLAAAAVIATVVSVLF